MTTKIQTNSEQSKAIEQLHTFVKPGDYIYYIVKHVSASGMSRTISFLKPVVEDGVSRIVNLDYWISRSAGYTFDRDRGGLKVQGSGMDMGFDVIYNLGRVMFRDGFDVEGVGRNGDTSGHDSDGGFALKAQGL